VNDCDLLAGFSDFYLPLSHLTHSVTGISLSYRVHIWHGKTRMAGLQSGEGRMMIDSVIRAQYVNVTDTQTATLPQQMPHQRIASSGRKYSYKQKVFDVKHFRGFSCLQCYIDCLLCCNLRLCDVKASSMETSSSMLSSPLMNTERSLAVLLGLHAHYRLHSTALSSEERQYSHRLESEFFAGGLQSLRIHNPYEEEKGESRTPTSSASTPGQLVSLLFHYLEWIF